MAGTLGSRLGDIVRTLAPGYFAFVMATGIISVGMSRVGLAAVSTVLLWLAIVGYAVLIGLMICRFFVYRREFIADVTSPAVGFAFFTFVAGTDVLATRLSSDIGYALPLVMLGVSFAAWLVMGFGVPWGIVTSRPGDSSTLSGVNGTWFVWAVASQSLAVLASSLQPMVGSLAGEVLALVAVVSWSIGVVIYGTVGVAVVIRVLTRGITPAELGPPYWITMGAAAITVLAGSRIQQVDLPIVGVARGLVSGVGVVFWSFASWLVIALIAAGWWRHVVHRVPLCYEAALWSIVFPLGMYSVASMNLGTVDRLPIIDLVGSFVIWIALAAWVVVAASMAVHTIRRFARA
ncbi:tellurite resistance/C4-dicarboxylate transporter family protein [Humibacter antri]